MSLLIAYFLQLAYLLGSLIQTGSMFNKAGELMILRRLQVPLIPRKAPKNLHVTWTLPAPG